jgi:hypothetical protein
MGKQVKEMVQGVKYPGYGFINEFNEFQFTPSEVGSRKEVRKLLKEEKNYTVYYTKNKIIFHATVDRRLSRNERIKKVIEVMNNLIGVLQEYDI